MSKARAAREPGRLKRSHFLRLSSEAKRYVLYASCKPCVNPWRRQQRKQQRRRERRKTKRTGRKKTREVEDKKRTKSRMGQYAFSFFP